MRLPLVLGAGLTILACSHSPPPSQPPREPATPDTTDVYGLRFDPRGADFTEWINDFKDQVYHNWKIPAAVFLGYRGRVYFEFIVERDGTMSSIRTVRSSGNSSLDRAARDALQKSQFLSLPDDYSLARLTLTVTFNYGAPTTK